MAKAKKKTKSATAPKRAAPAKAMARPSKPRAAQGKPTRKDAKPKPSKIAKPVKAPEKAIVAAAKPVEARKPARPGTLTLTARPSEAREAPSPVPSGIFRLVPKPAQPAKPAGGRTLELV